MSFWRTYYHVVWATKRREPLFDAYRAETIERSIRATCHDIDVIVHAVGFMPDHIHVAISSPPRIALSTVLQRMKGESAHLLNHSAQRRHDDWFSWQPEYGVMTHAEEELGDVIAYIRNQREHHSRDDLWHDYEIVENERPDSSETVA